MVKILNPSTQDSVSEGSLSQLLTDFIDGDQNKILLYPVRALSDISEELSHTVQTTSICASHLNEMRRSVTNHAYGSS